MNFAEFKADCNYLGHENGEWCMLDGKDCSEKKCPLFKLDRVDNVVSVHNNADNSMAIIVQSRNNITEQEWIKVLWTLNRELGKEYKLANISATIIEYVR